MAYSKAYQTVEAGRVREDEAIAFFGKNKVSCGRVTNFVNTSAQKQPTLKEDYLQEDDVGKIRNPLVDVHSTVRNVSAYNGTSVNTL